MAVLTPGPPARRIALAAAAWIAVALVLRLAVVAPEHCPEVDGAALRTSASEAVGWLVRNQHPDGTWLYRYDADRDADLGDYNVVRHAGVTMALYQAHAAGHDGALEAADRGTAYALGNLVRHDDWVAFEPSSSRVTSGATALLVAGLTERRLATGEDSFDEQLARMGRFLVSMVEPRGSVLEAWDATTREPMWGLYSPFFTGEVYWALTLLHREFPGDGWDEPARRVGRYVATERDATESWFPDLPDHWAALGMAVEAADWTARSIGGGLAPEQVDYVEDQAGLAGIQVRWESQRTDRWPNWWLRGRQTLGAGLGSLGEHITGLWVVADADARAGHLRDVIGERARCVAGMLVDRQVSAEEARGHSDPDRSRGAWFQFGVTQMDDQQHALSALLLAQPIVAAQPQQIERPWGDGAPWALVLAATVAAINPFRAASAIPASRRRRDAVGSLAAGGAVAVAVLAVLAWLSGPLLDALQSSAPAARIGAGLVLLVASLADLVRRRPSVEPALPGWRAGLVPLAVPALLRPAAAVVAVSGGADRGVLLVAGGVVLALVLVAAVARGGAPTGARAPGASVRAWLARVASGGGALIAAILVADGVFDV